VSHSPIEVIRVPAFHDNYLWLFHRQGERLAYVVDPGDAQPIETALRQHNLELGGILITHHHPDHTGGIDPLLRGRDIPVYGPGGGSVPQVDQPLSDGDAVILEGGFSFQIFAVPGHTLDHIAYYASSTGGAPILFCGDTLFAGGCGRLFEGSPEQMYHSLAKLAGLPDDTLVYCAHEYTLANLTFAKAVENQNEELLQRFDQVQAQRSLDQATVPSTIALEKATNPFMRSEVASVRRAAEQHSGENLSTPEQVLGAVRAWKDSF